jgi:hypothetical protein
MHGRRRFSGRIFVGRARRCRTVSEQGRGCFPIMVRGVPGRSYFRLEGGNKSIDGCTRRSARCLLWGEPGRALGLVLVLAFGFGVLGLGWGFGFGVGVGVGLGFWFWGWGWGWFWGWGLGFGVGVGVGLGWAGLVAWTWVGVGLGWSLGLGLGWDWAFGVGAGLVVGGLGSVLSIGCTVVGRVGGSNALRQRPGGHGMREALASSGAPKSKSLGFVLRSARDDNLLARCGKGWSMRRW